MFYSLSFPLLSGEFASETYSGGSAHGARARSAPAFGAERVARGSDPAATGARARSAHAIGAERVTRGDAGSQCAAALSPQAAKRVVYLCETDPIMYPMSLSAIDRSVASPLRQARSRCSSR